MLSTGYVETKCMATARVFREEEASTVASARAQSLRQMDMKTMMMMIWMHLVFLMNLMKIKSLHALFKFSGAQATRRIPRAQLPFREE